MVLGSKSFNTWKETLKEDFHPDLNAEHVMNTDIIYLGTEKV